MADDRQRTTAAAFKALHAAPGGFVMPNAWDAGSAFILAQAGFKAIATTSAGVAFSLGRPDYAVPDSRLAVGREEMFDRIRQITDLVDGPVNGDLEAGYGDAPETVAETIRLAIGAGLAGGNIEDAKPRSAGLYEEDLAVERIATAREAIGDNPFVLTARTDVFLLPDGDLGACVRRANRYLEAGADCVFTPGARDLETIATLAREIHGPLNIVMGLGAAPSDATAILAAGVQRISLGGTFARAALAFIRRGAEELRDRGTIDFAAGQIPQGELNALFGAARA
ncbi:isocitrate lyase/PEP mutase family protein [Phenylobacterium sp.]|uniref:isocitrate lyase/PEP mutase family protein n=1 Tax=Phenylobacterium sp. TaxID=1871053 RepID=UPI002FCB857C